MNHLMERIKVRFVQLTLFILSVLLFFFKQIVQKDGALLRSDVSAEHLGEMGKRRALMKAHFGCQANTSFSFTSAAELLGVPTSSASRFF